MPSFVVKSLYLWIFQINLMDRIINFTLEIVMHQQSDAAIAFLWFKNCLCDGNKMFAHLPFAFKWCSFYIYSYWHVIFFFFCSNLTVSMQSFFLSHHVLCPCMYNTHRLVMLLDLFFLCMSIVPKIMCDEYSINFIYKNL